MTATIQSVSENIYSGEAFVQVRAKITKCCKKYRKGNTWVKVKIMFLKYYFDENETQPYE